MSCVHCNRNMTHSVIFHYAFPYFHFNLVYPAKWYLVHSGYNNSAHMRRLSDNSARTCDRLDIAEGSQLLKTTLTASYNSLKVEIGMKLRVLQFDPAHSNCDKAPSLLLTHDSSQAIANGLTCNPFCEVPRPCQFIQMSMGNNEKIKHKFVCHCNVQSCNDLLIILRAETKNAIVYICDVFIENV